MTALVWPLCLHCLSCRWSFAHTPALRAKRHHTLLSFYKPSTDRSTVQTFQTRAQAAAIFRQIPLKFLRILVFRPFWSGLQTVDPWSGKPTALGTAGTGTHCKMCFGWTVPDPPNKHPLREGLRNSDAPHLQECKSVPKWTRLHGLRALRRKDRMSEDADRMLRRMG